MQEVERTQTGRVLAGVSAALDSLDPAGRGLCDEAERLALLELAVRVSNRLGGLVATLAREADQTDAATKAAGVGLVRGWRSPYDSHGGRRPGS